MRKTHDNLKNSRTSARIIPVREAVGTVLAHDITEIRPGEFKGRAFKKGHIVRRGDISHLKRLGKENLFILEIRKDEMHENDAACAIAKALAGDGLKLDGEPSEGKINLVAGRDGLLKVNREALLEFNMLGEVMCATIHNNSVVKKGQTVAGTRAIPLVVKKSVVEDAVKIAKNAQGILSVKKIKRPKVGIVVTGNEIYYGRIKDSFSRVITRKVLNMNGEILGVYFSPDDAKYIEDRIRELIVAGADLIITTGGMSVDPDDVTRFAIKNICVREFAYGSPVLPGAMFLIAYIEKDSRGQVVKGSGGKAYPSLESSNPEKRRCPIGTLRPRTLEPFQSIPILGIPACGMYSDITIFDMILPRVLAGERIGRKELAELGHGGLCLNCRKCHYPVCPFGK